MKDLRDLKDLTIHDVQASELLHEARVSLAGEDEDDEADALTRAIEASLQVTLAA